MILRLQKYHLTLQYCLGSKIYIADMLSRAYITDHKEKEEKDIDVFKLEHEEQLFKDIELIKQAQHLHMRESTQTQIKKATAEDPTMQTWYRKVGRRHAMRFQLALEATGDTEMR